MSYCICMASKYGNLLSEISWICSFPNFYLRIFSFFFNVPSCSILIQLSQVSPYCGPWFIRKHWQVSFKSTKGLDGSSLSVSSYPWTLAPPATGRDKFPPHFSSCSEIHLLYFQWISVGYFVIFLFQVYQMLPAASSSSTHMPTPCRPWGWG